MTIEKSGQKNKNFRSWLVLWVAILMSIFMMTGCAKEASIEVVSEEVAESAEVVKDEDVIETDLLDTVEEEAIPIVTEVVYDFDSYEAAAAADIQRYAYDEPIKGVYVSAHAAGSTDWFDGLVELADKTEVNAFVIDIKNDSGHVAFEMDLPSVNEVGADRNIIPDIEGLMDKMYEHDIFPIARIVAFKDPFLAESKPEYAIKNQDGSLWYYKGIAWLNPHNRETWDYIIDIAKEATRVGFKEIQFDYIRFEATSQLKDADFGNFDTLTRQEVILEFVKYARQELKPLGVDISADVFGIVISSELDSKVIGQNYVDMSKELDVICPMVYPSHYGYGFFGIPKGKHSDLYPYKTIFGSMEDSGEELAVIPEGDPVATVRPWLQSFTASWLDAGNYLVYGEEEIKAQIQGAYDAGLSEWILWNSSVRYKENYFVAAEAVQE